MTSSTLDAFLGGRLRLRQPVHGDRAGMDAVLLAAACPAEPGQSVVELGCGNGAAILCLGVRVPGLALTGVERNPAAAALARENAAANGQVLTVIEADLARPPPALSALTVDQVLMNPPYFGPGTPARDPGRAAARQEETPLAAWLDAGLRRLRPGGWLTVIQRADRLPEVLAGLTGRAGAVAVLPVAARAGRDAGRVILAARKGSRAPMRLLAPLVLHAAAHHGSDGEDLTPQAQAILRHVGGLSLKSVQSG